jgi:hypothetical protein
MPLERECVYMLVHRHLKYPEPPNELLKKHAEFWLSQVLPVDMANASFMKIDVKGPAHKRLIAFLDETKGFTSTSQHYIGCLLDGLKVADGKFLFFNPVLKCYQTFLSKDGIIGKNLQIIYNQERVAKGTLIMDKCVLLTKAVTGKRPVMTRLEIEPVQRQQEDEAVPSGSDGEQGEDPEDEETIPVESTQDEDLQRIKNLFRKLAPDQQPNCLWNLFQCMTDEGKAEHCQRLDKPLQGKAEPLPEKPAPPAQPASVGRAIPAVQPINLKALVEMAKTISRRTGPGKIDGNGHAYRLLGTMVTVPGWQARWDQQDAQAAVFTTAVPPAVERLLVARSLGWNVYYLLVAMCGGNTVLAYLVLFLYDAHCTNGRVTVQGGHKRAVVNQATAIERTRQSYMDLLPWAWSRTYRFQMCLGAAPHLNDFEKGYQAWIENNTAQFPGIAKVMETVGLYLTDTLHMSQLETRFFMSWVLGVTHTNFGPLVILPVADFMAMLLARQKLEPNTYYLLTFSGTKAVRVRQGHTPPHLPEYAQFRELTFRKVPKAGGGSWLLPDIQRAYDRLVFDLVTDLPLEEVPRAQVLEADEDKRPVLLYLSFLGKRGFPITHEFHGPIGRARQFILDPRCLTPEGFLELKRQLMSQAGKDKPPPAIKPVLPAEPKQPENRKRAQPDDTPKAPSKVQPKAPSKIQPKTPPKIQPKAEPKAEPKPSSLAEIHQATRAGAMLPPGTKRLRNTSAPK